MAHARSRFGGQLLSLNSALSIILLCCVAIVFRSHYDGAHAETTEHSRSASTASASTPSIFSSLDSSRLHLPSASADSSSSSPPPLIDLHSHTTISDGTDSTLKLLQRAKQRGIEVIALTDHDQLNYDESAIAWARSVGLEVIRGTEISCEWQFHFISSSSDYPPSLRLPTSSKVHLLGYFTHATPDSGLKRKLDELQQQRKDRNRLILQVLREKFNIHITPQDVEREARKEQAGKSQERDSVSVNDADSSSSSSSSPSSPSSSSSSPSLDYLGRPHIARALIAAGYANTVPEAFDRYLSDDRLSLPAWSIPFADAIRALDKHGAIAVLAHPITLGLPLPVLERELDYLIHVESVPLRGLEVYSSRHDAATAAALLEMAQRLGLEPTGGSDYHGTNKIGVPLGIVGRGKKDGMTNTQRWADISMTTVKELTRMHERPHPDGESTIRHVTKKETKLMEALWPQAMIWQSIDVTAVSIRMIITVSVIILLLAGSFLYTFGQDPPFLWFNVFAQSLRTQSFAVWLFGSSSIPYAALPQSHVRDSIPPPHPHSSHDHDHGQHVCTHHPEESGTSVDERPDCSVRISEPAHSANATSTSASTSRRANRTGVSGEEDAGQRTTSGSWSRPLLFIVYLVALHLTLLLWRRAIHAVGWMGDVPLTQPDVETSLVLFGGSIVSTILATCIRLLASSPCRIHHQQHCSWLALLSISQWPWTVPPATVLLCTLITWFDQLSLVVILRNLPIRTMLFAEPMRDVANFALLYAYMQLPAVRRHTTYIVTLLVAVIFGYLAWTSGFIPTSTTPSPIPTLSITGICLLVLYIFSSSAVLVQYEKMLRADMEWSDILFSCNVAYGMITMLNLIVSVSASLVSQSTFTMSHPVTPLLYSCVMLGICMLVFDVITIHAVSKLGPLYSSMLHTWRFLLCSITYTFHVEAYVIFFTIVAILVNVVTRVIKYRQGTG